MKKVLLFLILCLLGSLVYGQRSSSRNKTGNSIFPIVLSYPGIGTFFGAGFSLGLGRDGKLLGGATAGDLVAGGVSVNYGSQKPGAFQASFSLASIQRVTAETHFTRGTFTVDQSDDITADTRINKSYAQRAKALLLGFSIGYRILGLDWKLSASQTNSDIDAYLNEEGEEIETPDIHITPFGQLATTLTIGRKHYFGSSEKGSGFSYALEAVSKGPSAGYSGDTVATLDHGWFFELPLNMLFRINMFYSKVVSVNQKTFDPEKLSELFSINCAEATTEEKRIECQEFEAAVVNYLANHNKYGTARPLGGSSYLRGYPQSRFRGSRSAYLGTDLRIGLSKTAWIPDLYFLLERGYVSDDDKPLLEYPKSSVGGGLAWKFGELSLFALGAIGDASGDEAVFSLTVNR